MKQSSYTYDEMKEIFKSFEKESVKAYSWAYPAGYYSSLLTSILIGLPKEKTRIVCDQLLKAIEDLKND